MGAQCPGCTQERRSGHGAPSPAARRPSPEETDALSASHNQLIDLLPAKERRRLVAACEPFELVLGQTLWQAGGAIADVYFPTSGCLSLVATGAGGQRVEVSMIGAEGMVGAECLLGVDRAPLLAQVQGAGTSLRLSAQAFRHELGASSALESVIKRYLYVLMAQYVTSARCLSFHAIEPRLARWLLMSQDRAGAATFRSTHEFLGTMLGVRRAGVTLAAGQLQKNHLIHYERGAVEVLDRRGLEAVACGCYAADRTAYDTVMADGPPGP
jgi:CRP-like cAMP-binding protein